MTVGIIIFLAFGTLVLGYAAYRNVSGVPRKSTRKPAVVTPSPSPSAGGKSWRENLSDVSQWTKKSWFIALMGLAVFHLILGIGWPDGYAYLADLMVFWVAHIAITFLALTSGQTNPAVKVMRKMVIAALAIAVLAQGSTAVKKRVEAAEARKEARLAAQQEEHQRQINELIKEYVVRRDEPVEAVMPPNYRLDGWVDENLVESYVERRGGDKVRIFTLKKNAGVEEVSIKLAIYPCSHLAPCR